MLILLDRDGVVNQDLPQSVTSLEAFTLLPGVGRAISRLNRAKHQVAIVTNQACVGRGELSIETLDKIHQKMKDDIAQDGGHIEKIYFCADTKIEPEKRRKPAPGMILEALKDFKACPTKTVMIGDALRDLEAAHRAGCHGLLVLTGKGKMTQKILASEKNPFQKKIPIVKNLSEAVDFLLSSSSALDFLQGT